MDEVDKIFQDLNIRDSPSSNKSNPPSQVDDLQVSDHEDSSCGSGSDTSDEGSCSSGGMGRARKLTGSNISLRGARKRRRLTESTDAAEASSFELDPQSAAPARPQQLGDSPRDAVSPTYADSEAKRKEYADVYGLQHRNRCDRFDVPIWISPEVGRTNWNTYLCNAIVEVTLAVPGINLRRVDNEQLAKIVVKDIRSKPAKRADPIQDPSSTRAARSIGVTKGSVLSRRGVAKVYLNCAAQVSPEKKKRTATHELLHALGLKHEHQRYDAGGWVISRAQSESKQKQCNPKDDVYGFTRFDPYSIMLYKERAGSIMRREDINDPAWRLKEPDSVNSKMSELDKVALNLLYPPHKNEHYQPKWSRERKMYYCSRNVMESHNLPLPKPANVSPICGEYSEQGPNCPACRTLQGPVSLFKPAEILRWQGWSGFIYCGQRFTDPSVETYMSTGKPIHDGVCGPDYGMPCNDCIRLLYSTDHSILSNEVYIQKRSKMTPIILTGPLL